MYLLRMGCDQLLGLHSVFIHTEVSGRSGSVFVIVVSPLLSLVFIVVLSKFL